MKALTGSVMLALLGGSLTMAQPRIDMAGGTKLDLGTIYRGTKVERKLTVRNSGTDTLVIRDVHASCGCTGTLLSNSRIPPGGAGTLQITFDGKNFSGLVRKTVTVTSNDPNAPSMVVEFAATVVDEIALTPGHFWFKNAEVGRVNRMSLTVRNDGADTLTLRSYRTPLRGLVLKLPGAPLAPGAQAQIVAEFTPAASAPALTDGVFIATSNPRQPEIYVPVYGNAREFRFE